jgi:hypothetical protein
MTERKHDDAHRPMGGKGQRVSTDRSGPSPLREAASCPACGAMLPHGIFGCSEGQPASDGAEASRQDEQKASEPTALREALAEIETLAGVDSSSIGFRIFQIAHAALASSPPVAPPALTDTKVLRAADSTERENAYWNAGFKAGLEKGRPAAEPAVLPSEPVAWRARTKQWPTAADEEWRYGGWVDGMEATKFEPLYAAPPAREQAAPRNSGWGPPGPISDGG